MRTGKALSNIAYMRPEYFRLMTDALRLSEKIGVCYWIAHQGEDGDKDHIHFVLLAGQMVYNTKGLASCWGVDMYGETKGTVTEGWRTTKSLNDWLCYGVHDVNYLLRKGEERNTHYSWADIQCTKGDEDLLRRDIIEARRYCESGGDKVYRALRIMHNAGKSWKEVVLSGLIPVNCLGSAYTVWQVMRGEVDASSLQA